MFANILTNVSVGLQKGRLDWGNDWGAQWIQKTNLQRWKSCAMSRAALAQERNGILVGRSGGVEAAKGIS